MAAGRTHILGFAVLVAAAAMPAPVRSAQDVDAVALRESAGARVCLVTAENALGIPVGYASGFLVGEGKFAVTDLATLTMPGVSRATLRFLDGKTAAAAQFAMADPTIGLAVVRLEKDLPEAAGLPLSKDPVPQAGVRAIVIGWRWAQDLDLTIGMAASGLTAAKLAADLKVDPPKTEVTFLSFGAEHPDAATGAAVVDKDGNVMGVFIRVAGTDRSVVVPVGLLREAMLASDRQLRPLTALPKPVWPICVQPLPGKPVSLIEFAQNIRNISSRSRCPKCGGKGTVVVKKLVGTRNVGVLTYPVYRSEPETCQQCKGEGVIFSDVLYPQYMKMAEGGIWVTQGADIDQKARDVALTNGQEVLKALAKVGSTYRTELSRQAKADLAKAGAVYPRGIVLYAQVRDCIDGPDGQYVMLTPHTGPGTLAVRSDRFPATSEGQAKAPTAGHWIVLAGVMAGQVRLGDQKATLVHPFGWVRGPHLGGGPAGKAAPGPGPGPGQPPPPAQKGDPNFFGVGG